MICEKCANRQNCEYVPYDVIKLCNEIGWTVKKKKKNFQKSIDKFQKV